MAVAHAILAVLALANQPTPRHALRGATHDTRPDPIPRARDARAPPEHPAHTVLANSLLHTCCSRTHRSLQASETSARTSAQHTCTIQSVPLARRAEGEPAFMMLGRTPITCLLSIYDAGQRYLYHYQTSEQPSDEAAQSCRGNGPEPEKERRKLPQTSKVQTTNNSYTYPTPGEHNTKDMKGTGGRGLSGGRGLALQGAPDAGSKRPASVSPAAPANTQATQYNKMIKIQHRSLKRTHEKTQTRGLKEDQQRAETLKRKRQALRAIECKKSDPLQASFALVSKAPRNLSNTYGGRARQARSQEASTNWSHGHGGHSKQQLQQQQADPPFQNPPQRNYIPPPKEITQQHNNQPQVYKWAQDQRNVQQHESQQYLSLIHI